MTFSELPGRTQMTLGSFDLSTRCPERCWSSQPASANSCLSVASRCSLLPAYFLNRASTASRETRLYRTLSSVAPVQRCSSNTMIAVALELDRSIWAYILLGYRFGQCLINAVVSMGRRNSGPTSNLQVFQWLNSFESADSKKTLPCLGLIEYSTEDQVSSKNTIGSTD
jgi:hypothetical protein